MGVVASVSNIPNFIEAKSKKSLRLLMLKVNLAFGKEFRWFDIQKDGNMWVAWYYVNIGDAQTRGFNIDPNGDGE